MLILLPKRKLKIGSKELENRQKENSLTVSNVRQRTLALLL
jgi:hypothetical protein